MSWSRTIIGTPAKIEIALNEFADKLEGQSKVEFMDALPHLVALAKQNFEPSTEPIIKIIASGHGYATEGKQVQRYFTVSIERVYADIV